MSFSNIYPTPSTSLILIKSLAKQNIVFLNPYNVQDFTVSIRDVTGSESIKTLPVQISTINGAKFADNTTSYSINQPYGFVNMSLRTSTIWQILHTSGQVPAESAANVGTTNISTTFFTLLSTASKRVSTLVVENLETPNSIQLTGPFLVGNLSTVGSILFQSSLNVYGNASFDKSVFVNGEARFLSSLFVNSIDTISSGIRVYSTIGIGNNLNVSGFVSLLSTLHVQSSIQVQTLKVEKSTTDTTVYVKGDLISRGNISTLGDFIAQQNLLVNNNLTVVKTVSSLGGTFSTASLTVGGNILTVGNVSTFSTATFYSSITFQSSLFVQQSLSTLSTANITGIVSTPFFFTSLLSSSTSFSTSGKFTVLSSLSIKGSLSTNELSVGNFLSVATNLTTLSNISVLQTAFLTSLTVSKNTVLSSVFVSSFAGVGNYLDVGGNASIDSLILHTPLSIGDSFATRGQTILQQNIGVATDITVKGNITVLGTPYLSNFDVTSFSVKNLEVQTSSPSVAVRASTLIERSSMYSDLVRLDYDINHPPITIYLGAEPNQIGTTSTTKTNQFYSEKILTSTFFVANLSTKTYYTENIIGNNTLYGDQVEILTNASFPRGLSTARLVGGTITANTVAGNFIGNGAAITNVLLTYSTISASIVLASTLNTKVFSTPILDVSNILVSSFANISTGILLNTPMLFLAENNTINSSIYQAYNTSKIEFIQPISPSVLNVTNTLYLDSAKRKVGIMTSTPQYALDISGSLYYTGSLVFSTQNTVSFSTQKNSVSFSTILYSSIAIQDSLVLPPNTNFPSSRYASFFNGDANLSKQFYLSERKTPITQSNINNIVFNSGPEEYPGIYVNSNYSTLDINYNLVVNNNTRNVTINANMFYPGATLQESLYYPYIPPSSVDLYVYGNMLGPNSKLSTLTVNRTLQTSTLQMPTLGMNPTITSTINKISTSFFKVPTNTIITVNNSVEFVKSSTLVGSMHIQRSYATPYQSSFFCVYTDAYISSLATDQIQAISILLGSQLL